MALQCTNMNWSVFTEMKNNHKISEVCNTKHSFFSQLDSGLTGKIETLKSKKNEVKYNSGECLSIPNLL